MLKLGIFAWDFDGDFRGCLDDGFSEYIYIYPRKDSICRVGIWIEISDVFDDLIVEVFHRGDLVCGCGFSSHFHEIDLMKGFFVGLIHSISYLYARLFIAMTVAYSFLPC